jgi:hypothetical protein
MYPSPLPSRLQQNAKALTRGTYGHPDGTPGRLSELLNLPREEFPLQFFHHRLKFYER